eukprot:scaffold69170_cov20-Tisochrysis_lutea.AAC.1
MKPRNPCPGLQVVPLTCPGAHLNAFSPHILRLLCPLAGLKRTSQFELRMYDADWLRNAFMGQVQVGCAMQSWAKCRCFRGSNFDKRDNFINLPEECGQCLEGSHVYRVKPEQIDGRRRVGFNSRDKSASCKQ